jgi:PAS domain S-box-containing protein
MRIALSRPSLRQLLPVLFFLLAALPAGGIGVLLTNRAWDRELQTVHEQHLQLAQNLAEALTRYAEDVEATFQMTATTASGVAENPPALALARLLDRLHFKHICIVDGSGQVERLISPNFDLKLERVPMRLLEQLRVTEADADHPPRFSDVLLDRHGEPTLFLWQRLGDERYALGALKTDYFIKLQSAISFGKKGHAAIVDRRGRIIAHPNPQWRATMKDISQVGPVRRMMAGETGVSRFFSPAAQADMVAGFTTTPKAGWGVMIPQPVSELEAHVGQVKRAVWLVIGLALLCAALLGGLMSRWLAAPLHRIGLVAERFANGAYDARVSELGALHIREAASLATQFNAMADEVNHSWQAQSESEQRCREFSEIAADWFWETDLQQVFTYTSPPVETGRHWDSGALLGHHRCKHVFSDPQGQVVARIQSYMDREAPFDNVEYQVLGSDGQPVHLSVAGIPMHDAAGTVVGYRGVARDITERLHAQAQLRQAQKEERLHHARKMEAIGTMAGGIAHDFNNILTAILGYTELTLLHTPRGSSAQQNLQHVLTAGKRAKDLVQQILTFSRKSERERQPVHLHLVVREALKLLRASLPTTITIHQDIAEDVGTILADSTQIHQVMMNLGANAEYAMRETGGILAVRLDAVEVDDAFTTRHPALYPKPHVRLTMRDTGYGMAPEVMGRVFEPFFTTKGVGQGTGMGLAVVHGIVTSHNGTITVQSSPGVGTTFEIYFPLIDTMTEGKASPEEPIPTGKGSILFVDDEDALALLGRQMLAHIGYDVVAKTSSIEALETFRTAPHRFDLVITDQTMPHMTGEALARELRRIRPDLPIILCTGFSHTIDAEKAETQGIDAFLMKPLMAHDLALAIQRVLAQRIARKV